MLSGGVDSSAVVALMAGQSAKPNTFSIAFAERDYDESKYAREVAERYHTNHTVQQVDANDFSLLPRLPDIYDEPFGDVSAIPTFAVCALARRNVTVALSGDGGDEALAGYRRYTFHNAGEKIRRYIPSALRRVLFAPLGALYPRASWLPRFLRAKTTLQELSLDLGGSLCPDCRRPARRCPQGSSVARISRSPGRLPIRGRGARALQCGCAARSRCNARSMPM